MNVPAAHAVHCRSLDAVPAVLTKLPAAQLVHPAQIEAFVVVVNEPTPHGEQVRFVVAEPLLVTYSPGAHVVFATHAVAGFPS